MYSSKTGFDKDLLNRFRVILGVISSGHAVNVEAFRLYCLETAEKYVELYHWYWMPTTVHVILIHGHSVIKTLFLPIGQLGEEALESRNKDFRKYRQHNSRQSSRLKSNTDVFNMMLISSDPLITSLGSLPKRKKKNLCEEIQNLLYIIEDPQDPDIDENLEYMNDSDLEYCDSDMEVDNEDDQDSPNSDDLMNTC